MNVHASIASPVRCAISTIGVMSAAMVRAAQLAATRSFWSTISLASRSTSRTTCGPAPGRPMSAVSMPSRSMRCRMRSFSSIDGVLTDGDCNPSRSVSSSSRTVAGGGVPVLFQSCISGCIVRSAQCLVRSARCSVLLYDIAAVSVHRRDPRQENAERPGGREGDGVDAAAAQVLPHVDAAGEPGMRFRRLEQVAAYRVVHAHVVDAVPDDEREREPEDQEPLFDLLRGASPLGLPCTLSRRSAPRGGGPFAWLTHWRSFASHRS